MCSPWPMCRGRRDVMAAEPKPGPSSRGTRSASSSAGATTSSSGPTDSSSSRLPPAATSSSSSSSSAASKASSSASLASLRDTIAERPALFSFSEIAAATNNFLSKRLSSPNSSSSSWRCSLRGRDAVVFQHPFRGSDPAALPARLAALGRSHHASLVRLLGAALSADHIYLAYEFTPGASLADCLRNPRNPNFTPLSSWLARMQVAADLAQGLEYIHHHASAATGDSQEDRRRRRSRPRGTVHNRIASFSVIVTEPGFRAKICHFGTADLAGEIPEVDDEEEISGHTNETEIEEASAASLKSGRSDGSKMRMEGTRRDMAPELLAGGRISRRSDVYDFGVVLLELLSGEEPLRYRFDKERKGFERASLIEAAREAIGNGAEADEDSVSGGGGAKAAKEEERRGRIRRWVDRRLKDSYPVEAAERVMRVALRCVAAEPSARPDMTWVAGKVSKLFIDAKAWAERVKLPTDFSLSMAPR